MKKSIGIFACGVMVWAGCTSSKTPKTTSFVAEPSILKVGNTAVSTSEFKYVYGKNNNNTPEAYSQKSLNEYMELYTKFRLKVKEAEDLGLDTTAAFKSELLGYKKQLAQPYLTEKSVTERLVKQAYERSLEEVKASHILIKVLPEAEPEDSLKAYNKIIELRNKILGGENFEAVARKTSEDPSAKQNGGNLGYFSALQMVFPFEDGAFNTPVGQISMPVRTRFGYHIIKVADKRKSKGEVKVAHLMVRFSAGGEVQDSIVASKKISELYSKIQSGSNWEQLVGEFSDDMNSRAKGGELPPFNSGSMIPTFEEAAFKLENINDISKPVQTPYGFHIIKLLSKKGVSTFEEAEPALKQKVAKDSRSDLSKVYFLNKLRRENRFVENPKGLEIARTQADSTLTEGVFNYSSSKKENSEVIFSMNDKKYMVKDFLQYLTTKAKKRDAISPKFYMSLLYKEYINETLISYEENNLDLKYNDYKMLVKEYRDGILLFQLMDSKVWTKAVDDTTGLKKYYEENQANYRWGKRCDAIVCNAKDAAIIEKIKPLINQSTFEVINEKGDKILFQSGKITFAETDKKKIDAIKNVLGRDRSYFVEITSSADASEKSLTISKDRLKSMLKYLKLLGVDSTKIITKDLGVIAKNVSKTLKSDNKFLSFRYISNNVKSLEKAFNQNDALSLQVKTGKFQAGDDAAIDSFEWKNDYNEFSKNDRKYVVFIKSILEPKNKTFEEAKGQLISDYQAFLEKQWLIDLKKKYPTQVIESELNTLVKK